MVIIDERWAVNQDSYNYMPVRYDKPVYEKDKEGNIRTEPSYPSLAYCDSFESAVTWIRDEQIRQRLGNDNHTLEEALKIITHENRYFASVMRKAMTNGQT